MLIGIDGTGKADDGEYQREMKRSFVNQLLAEYTGRGTIYLRGPTVSGLECSDIARLAMIAARVAIRAGDAVHLTGYSRGGAIAIRVANLIRIEFPATRIPALALFDAVNRAPQFDASVIPGNVEFALHAVRDPSIGSRGYFGNCGLSAEPPCQLEMMNFFTTHGGMGGVPFSDSILEAATASLSANQELRNSDMVYRWIRAMMRRKGIVK